MLQPRWVVAAAACALLVVGVWLGLKGSGIRTANRLLTHAYTERRTLEMRMNGAAYASFIQSRGIDRSQSRMNYPPSLLEAEATISRNMKSRPDDPNWLQAQGRADLLEGNYDAAIAALEKAHQLAPDNSTIAEDLAIGYFLRGDNLGRSADFGVAVDILGKVIASHPDDQVALFNRAIALERLGVYPAAVEDWQQFLRLDSNSLWASEARTRLAALEETLRKKKERSTRPLKTPSEFVAAIDAGQEEVINQIDDQAESYLQIAIKDWLPQAFTLNSRDPQAAQVAREALLRLAVLTKSKHEDSWLSDLLAQARSPQHADPSAFELLSEAVRMNGTSDRDRARKSASRAAQLFQEGHIPAGELRAEFEVIYAEQLVHQNEDCYRAAQKLQASRASTSYAWLKIQALLESAVCASMSDERALTLSSEALKLAQKCQYKLLQIRATTFLASLSWSVGNPTSAWRYSADGLEKYWSGDYPYMAGYNLYTNMDYLAEDDERWYLQTAVLRESVRMIHDSPDVVLQGLEEERLGEALVMTGDLSGAEACFREAQNLFAHSPDGARKQNLEAEAEIGLASVEVRREQSRVAVDRLERVRPTIGLIPDKDLSLSFFQTLGLAEFAAGDKDDAERSLRQALRLAEEGLGLVSSERRRLEWSRKNEPIYRAMVQLKFPDKPEEALAYWEWYKGASLRTGRQEHSASTFMSGVPPGLHTPPTAGNDIAVIVYALFERRTAVWIYAGNGVQNRWLDLPKSEIESLGRRFAEHCADPHSDAKDLRREGLQLYAKMIEPIEPLLQSHKHLVIEADGALDLVPFEAMTDQQGRYLGDRFSLTFSTGLDYLAASRPWQGLSVKTRALVVGDPRSPGWAVLPSAEAEAKEVAALFPVSQVLLGDAATYPAIARELPRSDVFHFSGHGAMSVKAAGLVLRGSDLLDVFKLDGLSLRRNQLVVLSACSSAKGTTGTFNDPDGAARFFVGAGVPNLVASRWMVDSDSTGLLMKQFYAQLLSGKSVADALRLAAADVRARTGMEHPFYWASFAVFGRA